MFMVFSKEKILSYLISLGTVALLFVMSFAMTTNNNEILETSANTTSTNQITNNESCNNRSLNQVINNINCNEQTYNDINQNNCVNNI